MTHLPILPFWCFSHLITNRLVRMKLSSLWRVLSQSFGWLLAGILFFLKIVLTRFHIHKFSFEPALLWQGVRTSIGLVCSLSYAHVNSVCDENWGSLSSFVNISWRQFHRYDIAYPSMVILLCHTTPQSHFYLQLLSIWDLIFPQPSFFSPLQASSKSQLYF